jgi:acyl dehydratase
MAATRVAFDELAGTVGRIFTSEWREVTQEAVDAFAAATGDRQWIHVDPARAAAESPFGGTIVHGWMSLALVTVLLFEAVEIDGVRLIINYGANKVRFPAPVRVGARVRGGFEIVAVDRVDGGAQVAFKATIEVEGGGKPAMAAEILYRYLAA